MYVLLIAHRGVASTFKEPKVGATMLMATGYGAVLPNSYGCQQHRAVLFIAKMPDWRGTTGILSESVPRASALLLPP